MLVSNNRHSLSASVEHVGISLQVNTIIDNYRSAWGEDRLGGEDRHVGEDRLLLKIRMPSRDVRSESTNTIMHRESMAH